MYNYKHHLKGRDVGPVRIRRDAGKASVLVPVVLAVGPGTLPLPQRLDQTAHQTVLKLQQYRFSSEREREIEIEIEIERERERGCVRREIRLVC